MVGVPTAHSSRSVSLVRTVGSSSVRGIDTESPPIVSGRPFTIRVVATGTGNFPVHDGPTSIDHGTQQPGAVLILFEL